MGLGHRNWVIEIVSCDYGIWRVDSLERGVGWGAGRVRVRPAAAAAAPRCSQEAAGRPPAQPVPASFGAQRSAPWAVGVGAPAAPCARRAAGLAPPFPLRFPGGWPQLCTSWVGAVHKKKQDDFTGCVRPWPRPGLIAPSAPHSLPRSLPPSRPPTQLPALPPRRRLTPTGCSAKSARPMATLTPTRPSAWRRTSLQPWRWVQAQAILPSSFY